jgi:hypothetical protein
MQGNAVFPSGSPPMFLETSAVLAEPKPSTSFPATTSRSSHRPSPLDLSQSPSRTIQTAATGGADYHGQDREGPEERSPFGDRRVHPPQHTDSAVTMTTTSPSSSSQAPSLNSPPDRMLSAAPHPSARRASSPPAPSQVPLTSPCFVHSHLDRSLANYLSDKGKVVSFFSLSLLPRSPFSVANFCRPITKLADHRPRHLHRTAAPEGDMGSGLITEDEEDDEEETSLTRRLAETVVSVREMSKQLGTSLPLWSSCRAPLEKEFCLTFWGWLLRSREGQEPDTEHPHYHQSS